jgi:uncharacterized metal-binding protein
MEQRKGLEAGVNTHENVIYSCFGGFSNTGIVAGLASLEAVKELGLRKASIGCLAALPLKIPSPMAKTEAARRIVTVDGCELQCARKMVEAAGFKVHGTIVLMRDVPMKKRPLHSDIGGDLKPLIDYFTQEEVARAKELIVHAVTDGDQG